MFDNLISILLYCTLKRENQNKFPSKKVSIKETWLAEPTPNGSNEYIQSVRFDQVSHKPYNCTTKSVTNRTIEHPPNLHIYEKKIKYFLSLAAYKHLLDETENFYIKNYYIVSEGVCELRLSEVHSFTHFFEYLFALKPNLKKIEKRKKKD